MSADVVGFLSVVAMGLFTVFAIIGGYLLLNTAVTNLAHESAYYTFIRMSEVFSDAIQSTSSSATNMQFNPRYVIFTAYFDNPVEIPYYVFEGQRFNSIVVNQDSKDLMEEVILSSTGDYLFNEGSPARAQLVNCVGDVCLCIGEMTTFLRVEEDYLTPGACSEICWGESLKNYATGSCNYDNCMTNSFSSYSTPRDLMTACNNQVSGDTCSLNTNCISCVDFMNDYINNFVLAEEEGYNVLSLRLDDPDAANSVNSEYLHSFSSATKYAFVDNIIECRSMAAIASSGGRNSYCGGNAPYLFKYYPEEGEQGLFTVITTNQESGNYNVLMELLNVDYEQDDPISPDKCYLFNSFIQSEKTLVES